MYMYIMIYMYAIQVLQLLSEHEEREEGEVAKVKEQVEALMASYQQVESSGHRELNQIRGVATSLEWKWVRFYSDIELRRKNLHLSLLFQENLFEVLDQSAEHDTYHTSYTYHVPVYTRIA